jgi:hypothetical protein
MNALLGMLFWILGMLSPAATVQGPRTVSGMTTSDAISAQDVHIVNRNPRTVIALEDTHFKPSR